MWCPEFRAYEAQKGIQDNKRVLLIRGVLIRGVTISVTKLYKSWRKRGREIADILHSLYYLMYIAIIAVM